MDRTLNIFELQNEILDNLRVLTFESTDEAWLDFVVANRKELGMVFEYDIVI
ncbi:MAG: DUF3990 domain-containing protein, partial [Firmicutes bacterium]|nr:DUF3990 domain-containing protein [Bacillota bacterium]